MNDLGGRQRELDNELCPFFYSITMTFVNNSFLRRIDRNDSTKEAHSIKQEDRTERVKRTGKNNA